MQKIKKILTALIAVALSVTSLSVDNVYAVSNEGDGSYKYVMFADKIELNSSHVSINGKYTDNPTETMLDKQRSVVKNFILSNINSENGYSDETIILKKLENSNMGCIQDINVDQDVINTDSVLYSENGNINISSTDVNYKGLIYAPAGTINITGKNVNLNAILIAKEINTNAENITANKNQEMADFLGTESDTYSEIHDIYTYSYDIFSNITKIDIGARNLVTYHYKDSFTTCLESEQYANGTSINYLKENFEDSDRQSESALEEYVSNNIVKSSEKKDGDTIYYDNTINNDIAEEDDTLTYELTENNSIENVTDKEENDTSYIYDEDNQLIRVNDKKLDRTFLYSYDGRGNITDRQEYAYTEGVPTDVIQKDNYTYDSDWKDSLIAYNGEKIPTDEIGNPLSYKGWSFRWEVGNQLKTAVNDQHNLIFDYDDFGLRVSKTDNGTRTSYKYIDRNIVEQDDGVDKLIFKYDDDFNIIGVNINGTDYFYEKNIQNDIVKILDASGNVVVEYTYDPWGKVESITGELADTADTVGTVNPIRYRGYYYDKETELYYLRSRYYDPGTCRFINADNLWYLCCDNNLFKYCNNNPVNFIDENGHLAWNGGTPIINSAQDSKDYNALVSTAKKSLQALGFENITSSRAIGYLSATHEFSIRSFERRCHFLAQCAVESLWGRYRTELGDEDYFADKSYSYKYRGSGYIHITGSANYKAFGNYVGDTNVYSQGADYVVENYAWQASGWWWMHNSINKLVDNGASVDDISLKVTNASSVAVLNKNAKGAERRAAYKKIKKLL